MACVNGQLRVALDNAAPADTHACRQRSSGALHDAARRGVLGRAATRSATAARNGLVKAVPEPHPCDELQSRANQLDRGLDDVHDQAIASRPKTWSVITQRAHYDDSRHVESYRSRGHRVARCGIIGSALDPRANRDLSTHSKPLVLRVVGARTQVRKTKLAVSSRRGARHRPAPHLARASWFSNRNSRPIRPRSILTAHSSQTSDAQAVEILRFI
jgi:hypothetical protein